MKNELLGGAPSGDFSTIEKTVAGPSKSPEKRIDPERKRILEDCIGDLEMTLIHYNSESAWITMGRVYGKLRKLPLNRGEEKYLQLSSVRDKVELWSREEHRDNITREDLENIKDRLEQCRE